MEAEPATRAGIRDWTRQDWIALIIVTLAAAITRFVGLDDPKKLVFDETYYAKDACWYVNASSSLCEVNHEVTHVHPPLGKWLIGLGIRLFGHDSFGWRVAPAVAGIVTVALLYLLARKLLRSTVGATVASGLLAIDLLHLVQSRTSMLDAFVPMFGIAVILFLLYDRDRMIRDGPTERMALLDRPWRLAAGIAAGFAVASKWSGGFFIVLAIVLTIAWEFTARRDRERERPLLAALKSEAPSVMAWLVIVPILAYSLTYVGRLPEPNQNCDEATGFWANRLVQQQGCMFDFHRGLETHHSYESPPWSWIMLKRPVSYYFETQPDGDYQEIIATGNPFVWWPSVVALLFVAWRWIRRKGLGMPEGVILAGFVFTYGPWLALGAISERNAVFLFYLLPTIPFMCLALACVATSIGWSWEAKAAIALFAAGAVGLFVFYWPLLVKAPLSQKDWDRRIWIFDRCDKAEKTPTESVITEVTNGTTNTRTTLTTGTESLPPPGWCWI